MGMDNDLPSTWNFLVSCHFFKDISTCNFNLLIISGIKYLIYTNKIHGLIFLFIYFVSNVVEFCCKKKKKHKKLMNHGN